MKKDVFFKLKKKISFYALTITTLILSALLKMGIIIIVSYKISATISFCLLLVAYFMLLKIADSLKKQDIHGMTALLWSVMMLSNLISLFGKTSMFWQITGFVLLAFFVFVAIDGIIRLILSFLYKLKEMREADEDAVINLESVVAIITSVIALVISCVEMIA